MTNRGLQIDVILLPFGDAYIIPLNCCITNAEGAEAPLALVVEKVKKRGNTFARRKCMIMEKDRYEDTARSKATHERSIVFMQTDAPEMGWLTLQVKLGKSEARYQEQKKELDGLLRIIESGLMNWTELEPGKLHFLCTKDEGYATSENLCMQALQACEKAWGVEHASTLRMVYKLGHFYAYEGKTAKATEMYMRALLGYEGAEGGDHPSRKTITRKIQSLHGPKREKTLRELYWWK